MDPTRELCVGAVLDTHILFFFLVNFIDQVTVEMAASSWIEEGEQCDVESCCSDSGSVTDGPVSKRVDEVSSDGLFRLSEESYEYVLLKHRFYLSIGTLAHDCSVVAAYRSLHHSPMGRAQLETFRIFLGAMSTKCDGNPNVIHAWYGASKDQVDQIMNGGFRTFGMPKEGENFGFGLHLYPEHLAGDSVLSMPADADGLRHLVVCRVILGRTEVIVPGSRQSGPSSGCFDTGVDNQQSPSKYIVWYPDMKTNILPLYALTVKLVSQPGGLEREPVRQPTSPWMPFTKLVYVLSKFLPRPTLCTVRRLHTEFMERKITRQQFILRVRQLTGDKLLVDAIKDFQEKKMKARNGRVATRRTPQSSKLT